MIFFNK